MTEPLHVQPQTFTTSTLPDPRSYRDVIIVFIDPSGNRSTLISNGAAWVGFGSAGSVVNDLVTGGATVPLAAEQGVVLKNMIDSLSPGGGPTDTGIDGGGPLANYGGSTTINGGGPGATYG